jgi:hypothetical protein
MLKYWMVGVVAVVLAACSNDDNGGTELHEAEQDGAGMCPTTPKILTGTAAEGAACKDGTDCAPICCTCTTGSGQWLAAECVNDECKAATACADTAEASFCQ